MNSVRMSMVMAATSNRPAVNVPLTLPNAPNLGRFLDISGESSGEAQSHRTLTVQIWIRESPVRDTEIHALKGASVSG